MIRAFAYVGVAVMSLVAWPAFAQLESIAALLPTTEEPEQKPLTAQVAPTSEVQSVFFSPTEREAISQAKKQYFERASNVESEGDLLEQLEGIKSATTKQEDLQEKFYSQFYLESIMYRTQNDWTLWLKDGDASKKYTQETPIPPNAPLKIVAINKEDVSLEWKPKSWQQVVNVYKEETPGINLDRARQIVIFTLRVNQTMQSHDMGVKEGYVPPVVTAAAAATAQAGAVDVNTAIPSAPAPKAPPAAVTKKETPTVLELYKTLEPANK